MLHRRATAELREHAGHQLLDPAAVRRLLRRRRLPQRRQAAHDLPRRLLPRHVGAFHLHDRQDAVDHAAAAQLRGRHAEEPHARGRGAVLQRAVAGLHAQPLIATADHLDNLLGRDSGLVHGLPALHDGGPRAGHEGDAGGARDALQGLHALLLHNSRCLAAILDFAPAQVPHGQEQGRALELTHRASS